MWKSRAKSVSNGKEDGSNDEAWESDEKRFPCPKHAVSSSVDPVGFGC